MPKPSPRADRMRERMRSTWRSHPAITISGLVGVVGFMVSVWPAISWLSNHFETAEDARVMELRIRRDSAWTRVELMRQQTFVMRNRVNDCRGNPAKTKFEQQVCDTYEDDYKAAIKRFEEAQATALQITKEK